MNQNFKYQIYHSQHDAPLEHELKNVSVSINTHEQTVSIDGEGGYLYLEGAHVANFLRPENEMVVTGFVWLPDETLEGSFPWLGNHTSSDSMYAKIRGVVVDDR